MLFLWLMNECISSLIINNKRATQQHTWNAFSSGNFRYSCLCNCFVLYCLMLWRILITLQQKVTQIYNWTKQLTPSFGKHKKTKEHQHTHQPRLHLHYVYVCRLSDMHFIQHLSKVKLHIQCIHCRRIAHSDKYNNACYK